MKPLTDALCKPATRVEVRQTAVSSTSLVTLMICTLLLMQPAARAAESDQLLRRGYDSTVTGARREYFVYLPTGYDSEPDRNWPVILFLHGNGQRGDGLDDLDFVLRHGPLTEAWLFKRALPFVMISPQLPLFGEQEAIEDRKIHERPARQAQGTPPRGYGYPTSRPMRGTGTAAAPFIARLPDGSASRPLPRGWDSMNAEVLQILDEVLATYRTDPHRVYLTGISLGGFGAFHLAASHPQRFAALAPVVGAARAEDVSKLAQSEIPIWLFGGGKDSVVDPAWLVESARALEAAGHPNLRFTMHEDMDHDAWKRVYEGQDLFAWFLRFTSTERPEPEKAAP